MRQIFAAMSHNSSNTATRYIRVNGGSDPASNIDGTAAMMAAAGTINKSTITLITAPGAGKSRTYTLMKNGVATTHEIVIADAAVVGSDITHPVSFVAGDWLVWRCVPAGTPATSATNWYNSEVDTSTTSAVFGTATQANGPSNSATNYTPFAVAEDTAGGAWSATETARRATWPIDSTLTAIYVRVGAAPGVGKSWTYRLVKNGTEDASTEIVISGAGTTGNVTGLSIDMAPGDQFSFRVTPSGTPTVDRTQFGFAYTPDTAGQYAMCGINTTGMATGGQSVQPTQGMGLIEASDPPGYAQIANVAGGDSLTVTALYLALTVAPGAGKSRTLTPKLNATTDFLAVTISDANTTGSATGSQALVATDTWELRETGSGTPAAADSSWGFAVKVATASGAAAGAYGLLLRGVG